jgi:Na+/proline symporter
MALSWKDWKLSDIIYGVVVPVIVVLVIVGLSRLGSLLGMESFGVVIGVISEIEEMVVIVGVPMLLGLVWNRWAGGASGFIVGSLYALYWADQFNRSYTTGFHGGAGTLLLGYVVSAMFIGYTAGALNKCSEDFKRMIIAGLIAGTIGGLLLFGTFQLSPVNVVTGLEGFLLTVLPRVACGVIIPVIAKVFMWYGMAMNRKSNL